MKKVLLALASVIMLPSTVCNAQTDSSASYFPMGLTELAVGINHRHATASTNEGATTHNQATGVSGKFQTSALWRYHLLKPARKFTWGEILSAELFAGTLSTTLKHETGKLWLAYRFDFGFGGRFTLNKNTEFGVNILLLTFSRDNVSGNLSGSGIAGRLRVKKVLTELSLTARHDRVFGVLTDLHSKIPMQAGVTFRYLLPRGKNIGVSADTVTGTYHDEALSYHQIWAARIFYGIYM